MLKNLFNSLFNRPLTKEQFAEYLIAAAREQGCLTFCSEYPYRDSPFS